MKKQTKSKIKQNTRWVYIHNYPNGYIKAGIVKNSKLGDPKIDVIALEDCFINEFQNRRNIQHMTTDEALAFANALLSAVVEWNIENEE